KSGHLQSPELAPLCQHIVDLEVAVAQQKAELAKLEAVAQAGQPASCLSCGQPLIEGATFCPHCGAPVVKGAELKYCMHCGAELRPGARFCAKCGQEVAL
ncbi:MAG: zinc ribbon domain-containing protein, partial [Chloroflexi bacterium]|nr:zinc ribbon domain-containing protein [Chloroflexota bacterium]